MFYRDGVTFEGEWSNDTRKAGEGVMVWPNGDVYHGHFSAWGLYNGTGNRSSLDTKMESGGHHQKHLQRTPPHSLCGWLAAGCGVPLAGRLVRGGSGDEYVGDFKDGNKHGQGSMTYGSGDKYDGQWVKGTKTGKGTYLFADGNRYSGMWRNDRMEGVKGTYTFSSGDTYEGEMLNDSPHGLGVSLYANGNRYEGAFKMGVPCGLGTMIYAPTAAGEVEVAWTGQWRDGKRVPGSEVEVESGAETGSEAGAEVGADAGNE